MEQQEHPRERLRRRRRRVLWTLGIVAGLTVAVLIGYRYDKTLWDWLKLLIVPAVIAGGGIWFNLQQREREQRIASERAQDEALQGYLDGMSQLLTDNEQPLHETQPANNLGTVARPRTLTVLSRLEGNRKRSVLVFLHESGLIYRQRILVHNDSELIESRRNIVNLQQADLNHANLMEADLSGVDLSGAHLNYAYLQEANLAEADLRKAFLTNAHLEAANLADADLRKAALLWADLSGANLSEANLSGANFNGANLSRAFLPSATDPTAGLTVIQTATSLIRADLSGTVLSHADLREANLNGANLNGASLASAIGLTKEQITAAESLEGATMPDGQKYEDWLKDKEGSGKDVENV